MFKKTVVASVFYFVAHFAAAFVHCGSFCIIISCSAYQSLKKIAGSRKVHAPNSLQIYRVFKKKETFRNQAYC